MTSSKYGHCIKTGLLRDISHYTGQSLLAHDGELDTDCSIGYHCITKPMGFDRPHSHDFVEMLGFIGGDATDITDFGAEIEFIIGGEKHLITRPAIVSIPAGVEHCPINFKRVDKPIVFLEISLVRAWKPEGPPPEEEDK